MSRLVFIFSLLILAVANAVGQYPGMNMTVKSMDGRSCQMLRYVNPEEGHITLFVFWKTCCPTNLHMIDRLLELTNEYGEADKLSVVLVSVDDIRTANRVKPVVRMKGWEADVILDVNMELARAMSIYIPPQWVAVNHKGKPVYCRKIMEGGEDTEFYFEELIEQIRNEGH